MRKLHPNIENWLNIFNQNLKTIVAGGFKPTAVNAREGLANLTRTLVTVIPEIAYVQDDLVYGHEYLVPVRIYHPDPSRALPVVIYCHGGGHMAGSVTVYDPICRKLAIAAQHIVVSVEYRLAPECPYPAGINDAYAVVKNLWPTLDARLINYQKQLSLVGDSGGGAIVATLASKAQFDASVTIKRQAMIYPSLDYTLQTESVNLNGDGFLLSKNKIAWYFDNYFQHGEDRKQVSPLYSQFTNKLPETFLITAEFCPLRDEGWLYKDKLKQAGVYVEHLHLTDMIHTIMNMESLVPDVCQNIYTEIGRFLNR